MVERSDLIIVDEAHTSIAPSYTDVFRWLSGESVTTRMTTPLLGLTATAYRGHNEIETDRLVKRYGSNKLDDGAFGEAEPYEYLQNHRVLAQVKQQVLAGMNIAWTAELEKHLGQFGTLPRDVENVVGQNSERNRVILDSIKGQPDDWTILLFASSVDHARTLAAELSYYARPPAPFPVARTPRASAPLHGEGVPVTGKSACSRTTTCSPKGSTHPWFGPSTSTDLPFARISTSK